MNYDWRFGRLVPYAEAFLSGTLTAISLAVISIVLGTLLGVALGLAMRRPLVSKFMYPAVDIVRALPPLVLLLFLYYLLTEQVIGITVSAYWVAVSALSLNLAAFTSDLVRSGIESVPRSSMDAGRALSMSSSQLTRYIVLPHVFRETLPTMTLLYIGVLKMTSLASIINVRETVYAAQTVIADISRSLEAWVVVGLIYVVLVVPSTYGTRMVERWAHRGRAPNQSSV